MAKKESKEAESLVLARASVDTSTILLDLNIDIIVLVNDGVFLHNSRTRVRGWKMPGMEGLEVAMVVKTRTQSKVLAFMRRSCVVCLDSLQLPSSQVCCPVFWVVEFRHKRPTGTRNGRVKCLYCLTCT